MLHPFIPFVTEEIWLKNKFDESNKNFLMYKNWPTGKIKKDQSLKEVEKIIKIISELRSFKNELNVSPGSFVDVAINKIAKKNKSLVNNNDVILKKLGRINNFFDKEQDKPSATLVISGDIFKIYFDENVDLNLIKENLQKRQNKYQDELDKISQRLSNKGFTSSQTISIPSLGTAVKIMQVTYHLQEHQVAVSMNHLSSFLLCPSCHIIFLNQTQ